MRTYPRFLRLIGPSHLLATTGDFQDFTSRYSLHLGVPHLQPVYTEAYTPPLWMPMEAPSRPPW
eukprot:3812124-Pyramimonas_sp.AAC.1